MANWFWSGCSHMDGSMDSRPLAFQVITAPNTLHVNAKVSELLDENAKVPPKVRMFAWRVCRNSIPTVMNLARRCINVSGACPRCGDENENVLHCLLRCQFARLVWTLSDLPWAYICCNDSNPEV
ncbi:UNVERIFIED_CONTAM: hypothetical protein Slati_0486600 [Sesamum latifolium]|uniref:Reverse transcriptase zinc-binding domain-containing protein n=1 Tax=Sesamum latifolium TaxID=2727402 RepID=A0AAW2XZF3_9LAMI